ncbi:hypothetical protein IFR05_011838 [Cadophora sp. M221]|nr:hypothetical protein IFR05_011838 [Cadophora sp. M221]
MKRTTNNSLKPHEAATEKSGDHGRTVEMAATLDKMPGTRPGKKNTTPVDSLQSGDDTLAGWIDGTAVQKTTDSLGDKATQEHTGFAWSLYHHTLELFSLLLLPTLAHVATFTSPFDKQGEKSIKKSLGRLYLWGGGFSGGKLESVLDESESLRETAVESLAAIGKILLFKLAPNRSAHSNASEDPRIKQEIRNLGVLVEKARIITESDYESDESSASTDPTQNDSFDIITSLGVYVGCLMELLPSMEETLSSLDWEDGDNQHRQPIDFQISGPAQPYVLKVYDKFPLADMHLMHRLGEANWQRHMSLRAMGNEEEAEQLPQELPKITFVAVSEFQDSGLGSSLPARSTYAATVASHSSFQTTADEKDSGSLRVPPTPKEVSDGEPFNCQICGQFLSNIRNRVDWRRHVFADLKPYLCTFPGCKDEFKTFATRKLWEEHEFGKHRLNRYWACSTCQHKAKSPEDWRTHLLQAHNFPLSDSQYVLDARLVEVQEPVPIESLSCPLCLEIPGKSQRHFATHVGKHMEGIALAALPRDEESTDTESIASYMSDAIDPRLLDYHSSKEMASNMSDSIDARLLGHPSSQDNIYRTLDEPGQGRDEIIGDGQVQVPTMAPTGTPVTQFDWKSPSQGDAGFASEPTGGLHPALTTEVQSPLPSEWASVPSMSRITSRLIASQRFTRTEEIPPPFNSNSSRENPTAMGSGSQEQPLPSYTFSHQDPKPWVSQESGMVEDPADFIMRTMGNGLSPISPATINTNNQVSTSYFNLQTASSSTPISDSLTNATTLTSYMSRQNSLCNGLVDTMKFNSSNPPPADSYNDHSTFDQVARVSSSRQAVAEQASENPKPSDYIGVKMKEKPVLVIGDSEIDSDDSELDDKSATRRLSSSLSEEASNRNDIPRATARSKKKIPAAPKKCKEPGCGKEFKRAFHLAKHEEKHSRPWKCPFEGCRYHKLGWETKNDLNRHHNERHNAGQTFFECHFKPCPYQSKRESNCKQHMERAHAWEFVRGKSTIKRGSKRTATQSSIAKPDLYASIYDDGHLKYAAPQPVENSGFTIAQAHGFSDGGSGLFNTFYEQHREATMKIVPAHLDSGQMHPSYPPSVYPPQPVEVDLNSLMTDPGAPYLVKLAQSLCKGSRQFCPKDIETHRMEDQACPEYRGLKVMGKVMI